MRLMVTLILLDKNVLKRIGAVIRSGKVIGGSVNIRANAAVIHNIQLIINLFC